MADCILDFRPKFGKGFAVLRYQKKRVVAKTTVSPRLKGDYPAADSLGILHFSRGGLPMPSRSETGLPSAPEEFPPVYAVAVDYSPRHPRQRRHSERNTRRGAPPQCVYLQARIVRQDQFLY